MPAPASAAARPSPSPAAPQRRPAVVARDTRELHAGLVELIPELRARAMRLCSDRAAAEDIVQDTVERAIRFEDQYQRGTNLRAWAFQILFSVFVTRWRRRRRERNALENLAQRSVRVDRADRLRRPRPRPRRPDARRPSASSTRCPRGSARCS